MVVKESMGRKIFNASNVLFMLLLIIVMAYPLYYVIMASVSNSNELLRNSGILLKPLGFNLSAYKAVATNPNILRGYKNTIIIIIMGTSINMFFTAITAYVLSRDGLILKKAMTLFIIFTMFFSGGMIPAYLLIDNLGMMNTYWALVLPGAISTYNLLIMRTGFATVPKSLEEAARIDGANHFIILFMIFLPLTKASIAVIFLYYVVGHWNSWFPAMIYLQKARDLQPLQLVLRGILISNKTADMSGGGVSADQEAISEAIKYAVIVVSTLPILALYPFLQKYFIGGVMIGAVKG